MAKFYELHVGKGDALKLREEFPQREVAESVFHSAELKPGETAQLHAPNGAVILEKTEPKTAE